MKKMGILLCAESHGGLLIDESKMGKSMKKVFGENPYLVGSFYKEFLSQVCKVNLWQQQQNIFAGYGADNEDVVTFFE